MEKGRLRFVDVDDLDSSVMAFDGIAVESVEGTKIGTVKGFLLDRETGRPFHAVVDAGGWFKSKYFLTPVGHARLDTERHALVTDLPHERVERFPGFDLDECGTISDEELNRIDEQILVECCPSERFDRANWSSRYDRWAHYRQPDWWQPSYYRSENADIAKS